jgi:hypothetical protein
MQTMPTITRYFTKQCTHCPSVNVCATFERGTSKQLSPMRCCMCNCVWEPVSEYYQTMVDLGLEDEIDLEYEKKLMGKG